MSRLKEFVSSKKSIITVFAVVFLVVCLLVANFLSLLLVRTGGEGESVSSSAFDVYMLSLAKSQVEKEAEARASDFQSIGAGGYIWEQDGYYHVIASCYINKNDAVLVQNSVKANQGLESEIISVQFKSITLNGSFTSEEKKVLTKALSACYDYYLSIYDVAISLDTKVYNEISARLAVNNAHNSLSTTLANFNTLFENVEFEPIKKLGTMLESALEKSKELCGGMLENTSQTYSSLLKYRYTEVLGLYFDYIEENI